MATVRGVGLGSAFKVGLVVYGLLGVMAGALCSAIAFAGIRIAGHPQMPFAPWGGLLALIVCPLLYGMIGGIALLFSAFLYNLASGWVGGLEVDLE
jgi:hypothetical protein